MSTSIVERSEQVILNNYGRLPLCVVRGQGAEFWDSNDNRYIDFFAGFGALGITGHSHPKVSAAISEQAKTLCAHGNLFTNLVQVEVAEKLVSHSFPGKVFFCHSGAESNEAALKLARRRGGPDKQTVITFNSSFHGRTYGALSLCPETFQDSFGAMLPNVRRAELNNLESLQSSFDDSVAAIFLEPIQGEGGVNIPDKNFVKKLKELCNRHDVLYVSDEVWTAPGRTGRWYAYEHLDVSPDIVCMGKALGSGAPMGAVIVAEKHTEVLGPGTHGCTMGGNPLCASAALAGLNLLEGDGLVDRAQRLGEKFMAELKEVFSDKALDVRGKGFFIGVELVKSIDAGQFMKSCLESGLYIGTAKNNVVRFAPPLITEEAAFDEALEVLKKVLQKF